MRRTRSARKVESGKAAAHIGGDLGVGGKAARHIGLVVAHGLEGDDLAAEKEGVALGELGEEIFLHLAEHAPAPADRAGDGATLLAAPAHQAHLDHRLLDDGADIEPILLGDVGVGDAPEPVAGVAQPGIALIGA